MNKKQLSKELKIAMATGALFEPTDNVVRVVKREVDVDRATRIFNVKLSLLTSKVVQAWEQARQGARVELEHGVTLLSQLTLNVEQDNDLTYLRGDGERYYLDIGWGDFVHVESVEDVINLLLEW